MRAALIAAAAVAVSATTAAASPRPAESPPCREALPHGPSLPAPIVLWNSCGAYRLATDGRVVRLPRHWLAHHGGGTGRRYGADLNLRNTREGGILVLRYGQTIWRSSGLYKNEGSSVAFGPGLFAFASYRRGVYLTDLRRPERLVVRGRGLFILDFTRDGNMLVVGRGLVSVVSSEGERLRRYTYTARLGLGFDAKTDSLYFVTEKGILATVRGTHLQLVGPAPQFGGTMSVAEPKLLVWQGDRSITITTRDGKIISSARWRSALGTTDLGLSTSADGRLFAYRVSTARPGPRTETANVFILRAGEHRGHRVLRHRLGAVGCGVSGRMSWHGHYLLYGYGDDRLVVIDSHAGVTRSNLTQVAKALPKQAPTETANAAWASDFSR